MELRYEKIEWKKGFHAKGVTAEKAFESIEKIKTKNGGKIDPADLVAAAKSNRHPCHQLIEWDDTKAATEYRLTQARHILRALVITYKEDPSVKTRAYNVTKSEGDMKRTYKSTDEILADPDERGRLLQRALSELLAVRRKYQGLNELAIVFRSIDEAFAEVK